MADKTIPANELAAAIMDAIGTYTDEVKEATFTSVQELSKEALAELRHAYHGDSDKFYGRKKYKKGDYNRGWTKADVKSTATSLHVSLHNKKHYRLTHLLENGHAHFSHGKSTGGRAKATPHIRPIAEKAERELGKRVEAIIGDPKKGKKK